MQIITCKCGIEHQIPDEDFGKKYLCPVCKTVLMLEEAPTWHAYFERLRQDRAGQVDDGTTKPLPCPCCGSVTYKYFARDGQVIRCSECVWPPGSLPPLTYSPPGEADQPADRSGVIYLLKGGEFFKIGKTIKLDDRIYQLKIQLPHQLELVHTITTDDIDYAERHWHERFASKRANGEWFKLDEDDVNEFTHCKALMVKG